MVKCISDRNREFVVLSEYFSDKFSPKRFNFLSLTKGIMSVRWRSWERKHICIVKRWRREKPCRRSFWEFHLNDIRYAIQMALAALEVCVRRYN